MNTNQDIQYGKSTCDCQSNIGEKCPICTNQEKECCESIVDHTPVWAGDGYFCSKCMVALTVDYSREKLCHKGEKEDTATNQESWKEKFKEMFGDIVYEGQAIRGTYTLANKEDAAPNKVLAFIETHIIPEVRKEMLEYIKRTLIWSKGTAEGTRADLIVKTANHFDISLSN